MTETLIEIGYKEGAYDTPAEAIKKDVSDLGIKGARDITTYQLYLIIGNPTEGDLRFIAKNILCDPVTQAYKLLPKKNRTASNGSFAVEVWFKKGVTDNVGSSVKKAIDDLGLKGVREVRSGRKFIISGKHKRQEIINITTRLLANEVVEEYKIYGEG